MKLLIDPFHSGISRYLPDILNVWFAIMIPGFVFGINDHWCAFLRIEQVIQFAPTKMHVIVDLTRNRIEPAQLAINIQLKE